MHLQLSQMRMLQAVSEVDNSPFKLAMWLGVEAATLDGFPFLKSALLLFLSRALFFQNGGELVFFSMDTHKTTLMLEVLVASLAARKRPPPPIFQNGYI